MQTGGVVRVGMTERHSHQIVSFEIDGVSGQFFSDHKMIGNLIAEARRRNDARNGGDVCWRIILTTSGVATSERREIVSGLYRRRRSGLRGRA
jgi:hypothetical protein